MNKVMIFSLLFFGCSIVTQAQDEYYEAFMNAIYDNDINVMQMFLDDGLDINAQDDDGWTGLMIATNNDKLEAIQFLI